MDEAQTAAAGQGAHVYAIHGDFYADGNARLEVRVVFAVFAVVVEAEGLAGDVTAHGFAESRKACADVGVAAFHAEAGDELWREGFFLHGEIARLENLTRGFFADDDFVERADDVAVFLDALLEGVLLA